MAGNALDDVFATSDGASIGFTREPAPFPDAPRIVLVHSLALDRGTWDGVVRGLRPHAEIVTYDCRGHGRSARLAGPFTVQWFARDLGELLDRVGWRDATIAGCSMGGCVALAFAALYPARASRLGLIDTTAWYGPDAAAAFARRADAARAAGMRGLVDFQLTRWVSDELRAAPTEPLRRATAVFLDNDVACYASSCALLGAVDLRPHLAALRMPVTIVVGEHDSATPVAMARDMHRAIPQSTLTVLPNARHLTPIEHPDRITSELLSLLRRPSVESRRAEPAGGTAP